MVSVEGREKKRLRDRRGDDSEKAFLLPMMKDKERERGRIRLRMGRERGGGGAPSIPNSIDGIESMPAFSPKGLLGREDELVAGAVLGGGRRRRRRGGTAFGASSDRAALFFFFFFNCFCFD